MVKLVCIVVRMHHVTLHVLGKVWMRAPVRGPSANPKGVRMLAQSGELGRHSFPQKL